MHYTDYIWYGLISVFIHPDFIFTFAYLILYVISFPIHECCGPLQCCNHISTSRLPVNKRKDAQKLAQLILAKIQSKYNNEGDEDTANCVSISALENAFGNLDIKTN